MKTKFVRTNMKHYCIKDKKRYMSSELANRCGSCIKKNKCGTSTPIERLQDKGLI